MAALGFAGLDGGKTNRSIESSLRKRREEQRREERRGRDSGKTVGDVAQHQ